MVDVGRDDGPARRDFGPHEFGRHKIGQGGAKGLAVADRGGKPALVLADGHELHLRRDDAGAGIGKLGDGAPAGCAQGVALMRKRGCQPRAGGKAVVGGQDGAARIGRHIAARLQPVAPHIGQTARNVDVRLGIGIGARTVIDGKRGLVGDRDLAQGHADLVQRAGDVDLARCGQGAGGDRGGDLFRFRHLVLPFEKTQKETEAERGQRPA